LVDADFVGDLVAVEDGAAEFEREAVGEVVDDTVTYVE
jgi:hypothetical protein